LLPSRSMRARGLKQLKNEVYYVALQVALHASAWIETKQYCSTTANPSVALHASAWIETLINN